VADEVYLRKIDVVVLLVKVGVEVGEEHRVEAGEEYRVEAGEEYKVAAE